jgi:uncharacterized protein (UPF0262 family)
VSIKESNEAGNNEFHIAAVSLDEGSIVRWNPEVDRERKVAIYDLVQANYFVPLTKLPGPYQLLLEIEDNRLIFNINSIPQSGELTRVLLPMSGLRQILKDYFTTCESYHNAIKYSRPNQIEALDVGRRGLHDEGSQMLLEILKEKVEIDFNTARRLFTLICVVLLRS